MLSKFLKIALVCLLIYSCTGSKKHVNTSDNIFSASSKNIYKDSLKKFFYIYRQFDRNYFYFNFWVGRVNSEQKFLPAYSLYGNIYRNKDIVFIKPYGSDTKEQLFNFDFNAGDSCFTTFKCRVSYNDSGDSTIQIKKVKLILDSIKWNNAFGDSIYEFRFKNFDIINDFTDLVFLTGKRVGVISILYGRMYNGKFITDSFRGKKIDDSKTFY